MDPPATNTTYATTRPRGTTMALSTTDVRFDTEAKRFRENCKIVLLVG